MAYGLNNDGFINDDLCPNQLRALRLNSGHVYLIRPAEPPKNWFRGIGKCPIKIGVSKDINCVSQRLKALSSGNWMQLCVEKISPKILEPFNVEWFLHEKYYREKIKGEWYNLTIDEVRIIKKQLAKEPYLQFVNAMSADISSLECYYQKQHYHTEDDSLVWQAWDEADQYPYRKAMTWSRYYMLQKNNNTKNSC